MLRTGIVGLPNVGKSTLFNAVTRTRNAEAANYPFCTIDPNVGVVTVPDKRLEPLAQIAKTNTIIPAAIEFVDIAGLVKGASQGEGLGNQFLSHIRETDAIIQVVRCFEDADVHHVTGNIDPIADIETIATELVLADLEVRARQPDAQAILLDHYGNLAEGRGSNVFVVRDGVLLTPREKFVLAGISRQTTLELAHDLGIPVEETDIDLYDALNADEGFITSSSWCICPVATLNGQRIGNGQIPGPVTKRLQDEFFKVLRGEEDRHQAWRTRYEV